MRAMPWAAGGLERSTADRVLEDLVRFGFLRRAASGLYYVGVDFRDEPFHFSGRCTRPR